MNADLSDYEIFILKVQGNDAMNMDINIVIVRTMIMLCIDCEYSRCGRRAHNIVI